MPRPSRGRRRAARIAGVDQCGGFLLGRYQLRPHRVERLVRGATCLGGDLLQVSIDDLNPLPELLGKLCLLVGQIDALDGRELEQIA